MTCTVTTVVKQKPLQKTHEVIDPSLTAVILSIVFTRSHFKVISGNCSFLSLIIKLYYVI